MKGTRLQRINELLRILTENKGQMTFKQLYGKMALTYGISRKTFWDYLETLKTADKIDYPSVFLFDKEDEIEIKLLDQGKEKKE